MNESTGAVIQRRSLSSLPDLHNDPTWKAIEEVAATDNRFKHVVKGMLELRETVDAIIEYLDRGGVW